MLPRSFLDILSLASKKHVPKPTPLACCPLHYLKHQESMVSLVLQTITVLSLSQVLG